MTRTEMIDYLKCFSNHTAKEIDALSKSMSDETLKRFYEVEVFRNAQSVDEAFASIS